MEIIIKAGKPTQTASNVSHTLVYQLSPENQSHNASLPAVFNQY